MRKKKKKNCKCCIILSILVVILSSYIVIDILEERLIDNLSTALDDSDDNSGYVYDESDFIEEHNKILDYKRNGSIENDEVAEDNSESKDSDDEEKESNNISNSNSSNSSKSSGKTADDKIKEAQDSVSFVDKAKALKLLTKLSPSDIGMLKTMMSGGVSAEEKEKARNLALKKFTEKELEVIKDLYNKYKGLLN